jgi:hypothetical protein
MPAQSAVAPAAAIFNIVLSLVSHPGAHTTKTYPHTQEGALIWIKFYRPNWFMRRSFSLPDRIRSLALESVIDLP